MLAVTTAVLLWAAVVVRAACPHHRWVRFDTVLLLLACAATGDIATATGTPVLAPAAAHSLLVASSLAALLVGWEIMQQAGTGGAGSGAHPWPWRWATLTVVTVLVVGCVTGDPTGPVPATQWRSAALMTAFWLGYGSAYLIGIGVLLVTLVRLRRGLPAGPLYQAATLVVAALAVGAWYGGSLLTLASGSAVPGFGTTGVLYAGVGYLFVGAAALRVRLARMATPTADQRLLRTLEPLWHRLRPVDPSVALADFPRHPGQLRGRERSVACVRAGVEIRDWMSLVARRLPPGAYEHACTAAARLASDAAAAAAAGWVRAGLVGAAHGPQGGYSVAPPEGDDIDEDLRLLAAIAAVPDETALLVATAVQDCPGPAGHSKAPRTAEDRRRTRAREIPSHT